jgi:hypothetical protein
VTSCPRCERTNGAKRRYCGECGQFLAPACRRCDFANDVDDHFCGGCGGDLLGVVAVAGGPAGMPLELRDLFSVPAAAAALVVELPESGVSQDDLDRLFGVVS